MPVSSPMITGLVGLMDVSCRMIVRLPSAKRDSGSCGPPTYTCSRIYVSCEAIEIGEDAKIREQVYVGGPRLRELRFALGSRTSILQLSFSNPRKPGVVGDDNGIGG